MREELLFRVNPWLERCIYNLIVGRALGYSCASNIGVSLTKSVKGIDWVYAPKNVVIPEPGSFNDFTSFKQNEYRHAVDDITDIVFRMAVYQKQLDINLPSDIDSDVYLGRKAFPDNVVTVHIDGLANYLFGAAGVAPPRWGESYISPTADELQEIKQLIIDKCRGKIVLFIVVDPSDESATERQYQLKNWTEKVKPLFEQYIVYESERFYNRGHSERDNYLRLVIAEVK